MLENITSYCIRATTCPSSELAYNTFVTTYNGSIPQLVDCTLQSKRCGFQWLSAIICLFLVPLLAYDARFLMDWLDLGTSFSGEGCPSVSEASSSVRFRSISKMFLGNVYTL